jgi:hypothetical protein
MFFNVSRQTYGIVLWVVSIAALALVVYYLYLSRLVLVSYNPYCPHVAISRLGICS